MSFRLMHEMWIEKLILVIWILSIWEETVNVLAVSSHLLYSERSIHILFFMQDKDAFLLYDKLKNNLINTWSKRVICSICYVMYVLTKTNYRFIWKTMIRLISSIRHKLSTIVTVIYTIIMTEYFHKIKLFLHNHDFFNIKMKRIWPLF